MLAFSKSQHYISCYKTPQPCAPTCEGLGSESFGFKEPQNPKALSGSDATKKRPSKNSIMPMHRAVGSFYGILHIYAMEQLVYPAMNCWFFGGASSPAGLLC